jgi:Undecaprenyl-phosphate glucose phosphotransferase
MDYSQAFFIFVATIKIFDAMAVLWAWQLCWNLRFTSSFFSIGKGIPLYESYSELSLPLALVFSAVFHVVGVYRKDRIHFGFRSAKKVVEGATLGTLVFVSILYFKEATQYSRIYLALFTLLLTLLILTERLLLQWIWFAIEKKIIRNIRILLVGHGELLEMYVEKIRERDPYPVSWLGRFGNPTDNEFPGKIKYLGGDSSLFPYLESNAVDMIVLSYPADLSHQYAPVLERLSQEMVPIKVLPDFGKYSTFTYQSDEECGIPLLYFNQTPVSPTDRALKRIWDILGSLGFMIVFSPVYFIVALLIKITSKGPIFYSQERMGADGKCFTLYKFRSMKIDAESKTGAVWAVEEDNRVTPLGKWLRKTSLDEFPQFYNVLRGDMSLVGPRPERPVFVKQFRKEVPKYMLRHKMKSGITGWAQVNGWRGNTSLDERIKHDLYYIGHWSLFFDFKILCLTLIKGFVNRNAY